MKTRRRVTVAGGGAIALDDNVVLDSELAAGKGRVVARESSFGGNVATALAAVALNDGAARWVGYLPSGPESGGSREDLESFGIDTACATITTTPPVRSTILATPSGDRFIAFDDDTLMGFPSAVDPRALEGVDVLLVDQYASAHPGILRDARALGIPVVADLERPDWPDLEGVLAVADHLVVPLHFAEERIGALGGSAAVASLWGPQHSAVVVTDGGNGAWYRDASTDVLHVPAFRVDVVDTSGCGDIFHGIYALAIGEGCGVGEAVVRASAAGAVAATGRGGRGRIPRAADIDALIATRSSS